MRLSNLTFGFLLALLTPVGAAAQSTNTVVTFSNPAGVAPPKGYSHVVEVDLGTAKMVILSGQVALDAAGNVVGKGDPKAQFEQIFRNLQTLVGASGGSMAHVVKFTIFFRNMTHVPLFRDVRDQYINRQHPPASTAVEVSKLFRDELLAEVEATAIIPKSK